MAPRGNRFDYTTNMHEITVYYTMALYHGPVTRFPVKNTQALKTCATTMRARFIYNIKCGYSFAWLEQAEHFETKIEQIW